MSKNVWLERAEAKKAPKQTRDTQTANVVAAIKAKHPDATVLVNNCTRDMVSGGYGSGYGSGSSGYHGSSSYNYSSGYVGSSWSGYGHTETVISAPTQFVGGPCRPNYTETVMPAHSQFVSGQPIRFAPEQISHFTIGQDRRVFSVDVGMDQAAVAPWFAGCGENRGFVPNIIDVMADVCVDVYKELSAKIDTITVANPGIYVSGSCQSNWGHDDIGCGKDNKSLGF